MRLKPKPNPERTYRLGSPLNRAVSSHRFFSRSYKYVNQRVISRAVTPLRLLSPAQRFALLVLSLPLALASLSYFHGSQPVYAITPPDSCFAFDVPTKAITYYYDNESNNPANPACPKAVDIPATIGGVAVEKIASWAFAAKQLTGLTIPNSVTSIGDFSFRSNQLDSLSIPDSVTSIGTLAFQANQFTSLAIPGSVTSIGQGAFFGNKLMNLTLPTSLVSASNFAFGFNSLVDIHLQGNSFGPGVSSDLFAFQNPHGPLADDSTDPTFDMYSSDPAIVQHVYDSVWYAKLYTADPANPGGLVDKTDVESDYTGYDANNNGTQTDSLGGYLVNPAAVTVEYKDAHGNTIAPSVTITGETTAATGNRNQSGVALPKYLSDYMVKTVPVTQDPVTKDMTYHTEAFYRLGQTVSITPPAIAGYPAPKAQSFTLDGTTKTVAFVYGASTDTPNNTHGNSLADTGLALRIFTITGLGLGLTGLVVRLWPRQKCVYRGRW